MIICYGGQGDIKLISIDPSVFQDEKWVIVAALVPDCPLARAAECIGEWWTLELLHEAFEGCVEIEAFRERLRYSPEVLTQRLEALVDKGIMCHDRHGYVPTELGRSLRPVIIVLAAWGNRRLEPIERSLILVNSDTGVEVDPVLVDKTTRDRVDTADYVFAVGPAASDLMRAKYV